LTKIYREKIKELEKIIKDENLNYNKTYKFIKNAFKNRNILTIRTALIKILPLTLRFSKTEERMKKRKYS